MTDDNVSLSTVRVFDAVKALAFIGDLSMGQPTGHSQRTAWLATCIADASLADPSTRDAVRETSLLRWSGCTANAAGFADVFGDDIAIRIAMIEGREGWADPLKALGGASAVLSPLAQIHCEVSGEVARMLGLGDETETALRRIFETWDGQGLPAHHARETVPLAVLIVALAGDLEAFSRIYGIERTVELITQRADARYPLRLAEIATRNAARWLAELELFSSADLDARLTTPRMEQQTSVELIADIIDLKLPWMTGFSREVAMTAAQCCARLTPEKSAHARVYLAGLMHGIGRASVPNQIWNTSGGLSESAWEKVRLVPYWTARAGKQAGALGDAAELASYAYERPDGSGYFRGVRDQSLTLEANVLAASVTFVALRSVRPWRAALSAEEAARQLREEAARGRLSDEVVNALLSDDAPLLRRPVRHPVSSTSQGVRLTAREIDVLRVISRGASNKEAARELTLSLSTVRTHVENVFRKLECSSRAAATLKASAMGVL
ncbi:LuxR family transcriptional regulator [Burkholderia sp. Leaf177]|uniref:HD domain-containing phosphohydrolase n=1 Tax=Burkholderia sp. Leaf177 TaxID=1736287 RepID=UPI0006F93041|nr:HD domain-containing phosphohydrolase [Burkholderia sp. Leaf177]KQR81515.1 LuxR family transcriptional regulator [Burkholderia sp. Leaf177]